MPSGAMLLMSGAAVGISAHSQQNAQPCVYESRSEDHDGVSIISCEEFKGMCKKEIIDECGFIFCKGTETPERFAHKRGYSRVYKTSTMVSGPHKYITIYVSK